MKQKPKKPTAEKSHGIYADETQTKFSPEFQKQLDENLERLMKDLAAMTQRIFSPEAIAKERARIEAEKAAQPPATQES